MSSTRTSLCPSKTCRCVIGFREPGVDEYQPQPRLLRRRRATVDQRQRDPQRLDPAGAWIPLSKLEHRRLLERGRTLERIQAWPRRSRLASSTTATPRPFDREAKAHPVLGRCRGTALGSRSAGRIPSVHRARWRRCPRTRRPPCHRNVPWGTEEGVSPSLQPIRCTARRAHPAMHCPTVRRSQPPAHSARACAFPRSHGGARQGR